jgi:hypothetical protein
LVGFFRADLRPHGAGGAYEIESVTVGAAFIVVLYPLIGYLSYWVRIGGNGALSNTQLFGMSGVGKISETNWWDFSGLIYVHVVLVPWCL